MKKYITPKIKYRHVEYKLLCGSLKPGEIEATIPDINMEGCFCDDDCPSDCDCDYCSCGN